MSDRVRISATTSSWSSPRNSKLASAFLRPIDLLYESLIDPARRERTAIVTFAVYALLWTVYAVIAKSSQDMHVDMAELIAWSRDLAFGFRKHPPLAAIVVYLWFYVFPVADWSYYLLSALTAALALWITWRLLADYLTADKRVVGVALLTLIPFFSFHVLKFNVNVILMPLWAATTLWFLRSYTRTSIFYAALAGVGAAACLYAKYWSIFLLVGLALAVLMHEGRKRYFCSYAPWITGLVCGVLLIPHIDWLIEHNFAPFTYAIAVHGDKSFNASLLGALKYLLDCLLYVAVPVALMLVATLRSLPAFVDVVWPREFTRRLIAWSFWGPLLSPVAAAVIAGFKPVALWSMSMWTLLPVMLLSSPAVTIGRREARNVLALAVAVPLVALLVSPSVAVGIHWLNAVEPPALHGRILAMHVAETWRSVSAEPLRFVDGIEDLAYEVAAYVPDKPRSLANMPPVKPAKVARSGKTIVCYSGSSCAVDALRSAAYDPASRIVEVVISRDYLGVWGAPQSYLIIVIPPTLPDFATPAS